MTIRRLKENSGADRTFKAPAPDALALSIAAAICSGPPAVRMSRLAPRTGAALESTLMTYSIGDAKMHLRDRFSGDVMAIPRLCIHIVLANGAILGPTEITLLESIEANGSIQATARSGGFSYRYAWNLVQAINEIFDSPAVLTERGGYNRGGSELTATGKQVVAMYHLIKSRLESAFAQELRELNSMVRENVPSQRSGEKDSDSSD
jgi:molybdate transport system regulatory protein